MDVKSFLEQLPVAASSPLALAAYAIMLAAWIIHFWLRQKPQRETRRILEQFKDDNERNRALAALLGTAPPRGLARKEILKWVKLQSAGATRTYLLIAYLATLVAILIIVVSAIFMPKPEPGSNVKIRLHGVAGPGDCPPLPLTARLVVSLRQDEVTAALKGCEAEILKKAGWRPNAKVRLSLRNAGTFSLAQPQAEYSLSDSAWLVEVIQPPDSPRLTVHLFNYAGAAELPERREKFDQFCTIIRNKINMLSEVLASRTKGCGYVAGLNVVRSERALDWSPSDTFDYWKKSHSLQLLSGILVQNPAGYFVRSQPYLGDLAGTTPASRIQLELKIDEQEFSQTVDSHSLAVLYALAMDARRLNYSDEVVFTYLGEAVSIARGLGSTSVGASLLKEALRNAFIQMGRPAPVEL